MSLFWWGCRWYFSKKSHASYHSHSRRAVFWHLFFHVKQHWPKKLARLELFKSTKRDILPKVLNHHLVASSVPTCRRSIPWWTWRRLASMVVSSQKEMATLIPVVSPMPSRTVPKVGSNRSFSLTRGCDVGKCWREFDALRVGQKMLILYLCGQVWGALLSRRQRL